MKTGNTHENINQMDGNDSIREEVLKNVEDSTTKEIAFQIL